MPFPPKSKHHQIVLWAIFMVCLLLDEHLAKLLVLSSDARYTWEQLHFPSCTYFHILNSQGCRPCYHLLVHH